MAGGKDDDSYLVDSTKEIISEAANQGDDDVRSTISYTLGANVEDLRLVGNADINGTGNGLDNFMLGNEGKNRLDGGAGNSFITLATLINVTNVTADDLITA